MEIDTKTIDNEKVYLRLITFDQVEINLSITLKEYERITDVDLVDCAKIAYNNISTHGSKLMCETAIDLEGIKIYMGYWTNDGVIEIHDIRRLNEDEFKIFIDYRNEKQNLN